MVGVQAFEGVKSGAVHATQLLIPKKSLSLCLSFICFNYCKIKNIHCSISLLFYYFGDTPLLLLNQVFENEKIISEIVGGGK